MSNLTDLAKKLGFNVGKAYSGSSQIGSNSKAKETSDKYQEVEWKYDGNAEEETKY